MPSRVLLLTFEFPPHPGGIGRYARQIAGELSAHDVEVAVLAARGRASRDAIQEHDAALPFRVTRYPKIPLRPLSVLNRFRVAMAECRRFAPDLSFVCNYGSAHLAGVLRARFGVDYVVMGHGTEFLSHSRGLDRILYVRLLKRARGYLSNSRHTQGIMCDFIGVEKESIRVVPLGADSDVFTPTHEKEAAALRKTLHLEDAFVMLTVGRIGERKGHDVAIRAMAQLAPRHPALRYVIVGQGPLRNDLRRLAAEHGIADRVLFAGFVDDADLPAFYQMADLFVLPSRLTRAGETEGFGIVICEANLMGVPAIGTSGCGIEDALVDGVTGMLVKPDSVTELANALDRFLSDRSLVDTMGKRAREHALANHTWNRTGERTFEYLNSVLRNGSTR